QYVRNTFVEDQFVDAEKLRAACMAKNLPLKADSEAGELTIDRFVGLLRHHGNLDGQGTLDPVDNWSNASAYLEPFYFVWESIVRGHDDGAEVNLLLNRASSWVDVDSYLPYEGKVVLHN